MIVAGADNISSIFETRWYGLRCRRHPQAPPGRVHHGGEADHVWRAHAGTLATFTARGLLLAGS
jgi:hypothetical protein